MEPGNANRNRDRRSPANQWKFYDRQTDVAKARALKSLQIVNQIDLLVEAGMSKSHAVSQIAGIDRISPSSIWNWLRLTADVCRHNRLAYLIPEFKGGGRLALIEDDDLQAVANDYLRPERPSWASCIRRLHLTREAGASGLPHAKTLWRRLHRRVGAATIAALRRQ